MDRYKILIIDDDEVTQVLLAEYLELSGYQVYQAYNGQEGLELMRQTIPDLVLLDVRMPQMDGFSTLEALKKIPALQKVQVLFLSALDQTNLKIRGIELGAEDYVVKPFEKAELLARIRGALRRSARYTRFQGMMEGFLSEISLAELLQTMEIGNKSAIIRLKEMNAELVVENGNLIQIQFRQFTGLEALHRIFLRAGGMFSITFGNISPSIPGSPYKIQHALLDTMTQLDELMTILGEWSVPDRLLSLVKRDKIPPEIEKFRGHFPLTFGELIVFMESKLKSNAMIVLQAIDEGILAAEARSEHKGNMP